MPVEASSLPDDPQALKALVLQLQGSLRAHDLLVQALRLQIARLKRQKFGAPQVQQQIAISSWMRLGKPRHFNGLGYERRWIREYCVVAR